MVTTTSSRLDISTLDSPDMELSLLRLAWCEILRLPGLVGECRGHVTSCPPITAHLLGRLSTLPPPDSWVRTPGVDRDRGSDMARRGAGSRGLQLTRGGSTRDQGWCLQEAETSTRRGQRSGAAELGHTPGSGEQELAAGQEQGPAGHHQLRTSFLLAEARARRWRLHQTCLARGKRDEI